MNDRQQNFRFIQMEIAKENKGKKRTEEEAQDDNLRAMGM